jgi:hypothetical protein
MTRYAQIISGVVVNVTDSAVVPTAPGLWVPCPSFVGIGWTTADNVNFVAPVAVELRITYDAFKERFTNAEGILCEQAAWGGTAQNAEIRFRERKLANKAAGFRLSGNAVTQLLALYVTAAALTAPRANQIQTDPVRDGEAA